MQRMLKIVQKYQKYINLTLKQKKIEYKFKIVQKIKKFDSKIPKICNKHIKVQKCTKLSQKYFKNWNRY